MRSGGIIYDSLLATSNPLDRSQTWALGRGGHLTMLIFLFFPFFILVITMIIVIYLHSNRVLAIWSHGTGRLRLRVSDVTGR
jgi:hypothetical protein